MKSFVNWNEKKQKKYTTSSTYNKNFKTDDGVVQTTKKQNNHNQKTVSILDIANLQMKITHQIQKAREKDYYQKNPYELTPEEEQEKRITRIKREDALGRLLKQNKPTSSLNKTPPHILTIIIIALIILIVAFS